MFSELEAFWAVQVTEDFDSPLEAGMCLSSMMTQEGFLGGRVIPPPTRGWWEFGVEPKKVWRMQTIHTDCGLENANLLPDGMRRVLVLPSMLNMFGIRNAADRLQKGRSPHENPR